MVVPSALMGKHVPLGQLLDNPLEAPQKKILANIALNTANGLGATYADVRIGRYLTQIINTSENNVDNIVNTESYGCGVRVLVDGAWGFAATNEVAENAILEATRQAVALAQMNSKYQKEPVQLAPAHPCGEVSWKAPIKKHVLEVPMSEKVGLLLQANGLAMANGANYISSGLYAVNEQKYFASTEGSYIDQDIHRVWPTFVVTAISPDNDSFKCRKALSSPMGMGWEYLVPKETEKIVMPAGITSYRYAYDILEDAKAAAQQARELLGAPPVAPGKYDLVLEPSHLGHAINETIGRSLELDRVLGYEADCAGTSFATLDKWQSNRYKIGSEIVSFVADKTQSYSLGQVAYDDEGTKTAEWDLVKDGILVNYQATRDHYPILGEEGPYGCNYADNWGSVQMEHMPNISLRPGKDKYSALDMVRDVEKGIFVVGGGFFSADQLSYNFQFGGALCYEIRNGNVIGVVADMAYQSNTPEFWNSCAKICDKSDYRLFGSLYGKKGQPPQFNAVSHGCPTARFNEINVVNTERID